MAVLGSLSSEIIILLWCNIMIGTLQEGRSSSKRVKLGLNLTLFVSVRTVLLWVVIWLWLAFRSNFLTVEIFRGTSIATA